MTVADADVTELPASPGARLRHERESLGLSPQEAAEQLTVDISVIHALEANDFAALGAPVFAKGHLRRYANFLGVPADDMIAGYEHSATQPEQPTLVPRARIEMAPVRGPTRWPYVVGGAAAFVLAAALVAYLSANGFSLPWGHSRSVDHEGASAVAAEGPAPATETTPVPSAAPSPPASAANSGAALAAGQVTLRLRFAADSWIEVYDGTGKAVLYDLGKAGTERGVTALAPLSVTVGNAPAVTVIVNGRSVALPPLPPGQTVARVGVGADGTVR